MKKIESALRHLLELFGLFSLFAALYKTLFQYKIEPLAYICLPIVAVLFGYTNLLYNRARALPSGPEQRRSLYAAERAMQATIFFLIGFCLALTIVAIYFWLGYTPKPISPEKLPVTLTIFVAPTIYFVWGYICFIFAFRAISKRLLGHVPIKSIIKRLK
jgi:hypothetical protein